MILDLSAYESIIPQGFINISAENNTEKSLRIPFFPDNIPYWP
jgi:hypothetical protein